MNIAEVLIKLQEVADAPFSPENFPLELIGAYAPPKATLAKLRHGALNKAARQGDLVWPKKLHFRAAKAGEAGQALEILIAEWVGKKSKPRILLSSDGQDIAAFDTKLDDTLHIPFANLSERYDYFLPLAGVERYQGVADSPADIKAAARLGKFYEAILEKNPSWTAKNRVHELNLFLTRTLFCLFAQSTGIFAKDLLPQTLNECTSIDGSDMHTVLRAIFESLATNNQERSGIPEYAKRFPYVNGVLFRDRTEVPAFSRIGRRILLDAAKLSWAEITPDIFGSMIQAVVKSDTRDELGLHYTSVPNIMKVLGPLFLDSLEEDLAAAGSDIKRLNALLARIRSIRVFDPACGSGNFLIIAYKELCKIEMRVFELLKTHDKQFKLPFSEVQLTNFVGIELDDFAVETAKLSLYIAQHQMNVLFKQTFGVGPADLPLRDSGRVVCGNALRIDWADVCPAQDGCELFIVGNPPFHGARKQSDSQKADLRIVFAGHDEFKDCDYVTGWFLKASAFISGSEHSFCFVATNSIAQGEQVAYLWRRIFAQNQEILFAHRSFRWSNSAQNNAGVFCVVIAVCNAGRTRGKKAIFDGGFRRTVNNVSPYLLDGDNTLVYSRKTPISAFLPKMMMGNMPRDGGHLILSTDEKSSLETLPAVRGSIKRFMGTREFTQSLDRWCLWIEDSELSAMMKLPAIKNRIAAVRQFRLESEAKTTNQYAAIPHKFAQRCHKDTDAIIVPSVASNDTGYLMAGFVSSDTVVSNLAFVIYDAKPFVLAVLSSHLHSIWAETVSGRLGMGLRYSATISYNTFPLPDLSSEQIALLEERVWDLMSEREKHGHKSLSELYGDKMPIGLSDAHRAIDDALERVYNGQPFANDTERLEHLFKRYKLMIAKESTPLLNLKKRKSARPAVNA